MKVFLGGTVVQDKTLDDKYGWRKDLIPKLKVDYYNPVVYKRDKNAYEEEFNQKNNICTHEVYCITVDCMGYFSVCEAVDSSYRHGNPSHTIFCILNKNYFPYGKLRSLEDVEELLKRRGCYIAKDLDDIANYLNNFKER